MPIQHELKTFSIHVGDSKRYRDNWDRIFNSEDSAQTRNESWWRCACGREFHVSNTEKIEAHKEDCSAYVR